MQINHFLRGASLAAALTVATITGYSGAYAQTDVLPTGATITPNAASGSSFQPLKVALRITRLFTRQRRDHSSESGWQDPAPSD
jgi:hypothetical protein